jgi:hypothetical protein
VVEEEEEEEEEAEAEAEASYGSTALNLYSPTSSPYASVITSV